MPFEFVLFGSSIIKYEGSTIDTKEVFDFCAGAAISKGETVILEDGVKDKNELEALLKNHTASGGTIAVVAHTIGDNIYISNNFTVTNSELEALVTSAKYGLRVFLYACYPSEIRGSNVIGQVARITDFYNRVTNNTSAAVEKKLDDVALGFHHGMIRDLIRDIKAGNYTRAREFKNRKSDLPAPNGSYREFDVPNINNSRGAYRIVADIDDKKLKAAYLTTDHYEKFDELDI